MKKLILCASVLWIGLFCGGCNPIEDGIAGAVQVVVIDFINGLLQGGAL